jgi:hypothetical protein
MTLIRTLSLEGYIGVEGGRLRGPSLVTYSLAFKSLRDKRVRIMGFQWFDV